MLLQAESINEEMFKDTFLRKILTEENTNIYYDVSDAFCFLNMPVFRAAVLNSFS